MSVIVNFVGRLGKDAESHDSKSNGKFTTYTVAVDEYNQETKQNETTWIRVIDWSDRTSNLLQYLKKGTMVQVVGSEKVSIYNGQNGPQISREVRAYNLDFVRVGKKADETQEQPTEAPQVAQPTVVAQPSPTVVVTPTTGTFVPPSYGQVISNTSNQKAIDDLPF